MAPESSEELIARALQAQDSGDFELLDQISRELLTRMAETSDQHGLAMAYRFFGNARHYFSDARGAEVAYERSLEIAQTAGDEVEAALAMIGLGNMALEQHNNVAEGRRLHELAEPIIRANGDPRRLGILTGNLGEIARVEGDFERGLAYARESLALFQSIGDQPRSAWQFINIALIYAQRREYSQAFDHLERAWETLAKGFNAYWMAMYFDAFFMLAVTLKQWETAAKIMGFTEMYRDRHHVPRLLGLMSAWYPRAVERLVQYPDQERLFSLRLLGSALSETEAHALGSSIRP